MTCFRKTLISCVFSGGLVAAPTAAWGQDASWRPSFLTQTEVEFEADLDLLIGVGRHRRRVMFRTQTCGCRARLRR